MSDPPSRALLPAGLADLLPPHAAREAEVVEGLLALFAEQGYDRVKPPMMEFEDTLASGAGEALATRTFRLVDPTSRRMLAIRSDMTVQVARIAATRLAATPRPLRLAYAGEVLRISGDQLRPERQFRQVGVELLGSLATAADVEVILLAADALRRFGVERLSIDLAVPTLVPTILRSAGITEAEAERLGPALRDRDAAGVRAVGGPAAAALERLIAASGSAEGAIAALAEMELPAAAELDRRRLKVVVETIAEAAPWLSLTVDLVERLGFEYQTGVSFTIFARGVRGELGRGGRYRAGLGTSGEGEPATGFSLYMDAVLRAVAPAAPRDRAYLPHGAPRSWGEAVRGLGLRVIAGLDPAADPVAEARRLGCSHLIRDGRPEPL